MNVPLAIRKLIRPLIPDALMARYRLHQHSRQVRTNVDVVVDSSRLARRWLAVTPDTYRVRVGSPGEVRVEHLVVAPLEALPNGDGVVVLVDGDVEGDAAVAASLTAMGDGGAGVVGFVPTPRLVGRRRAEPEVGPVAIAAPRSILDEVGGVPVGDHPLPGLLARLRDAGHRLVLAPADRAASPHRTDRIDRPGVVILAAVPMHDIGGGGRGAQLALELLAQGFHVTYVALYGTAESVDLGLRFVHPNLEQVRLDQFDPQSTTLRTGEPALALFEVPAPRLLPALSELSGAGYRTVYDRIDDWSAPSLGGDWYDAAVEARFIDRSDVLTGSAPDLVAYLESHGGRPAALIPNAVNTTVFGGDPGPPPDDFPSGDGPVLGYHGSLYGDWFDWRALTEVAVANPSAPVIVIGDDKVPRPPLPANVHMLGLKPQTSLPAYVQRFDVGLVPFLVTHVTHAVSPLKAYEYLASGVPVAAPPLRSLAGLAGVHTAANLVDAVSAAIAGPRPDRAVALEEHSWERRVQDLLATAGIETPAAQGHRATMVLRPVVHYPKKARSW